MDMEITDSLYLKQLSRYDEAAIKLLFEQYYVPLVLFAKSYVQDHDVAKDVVQDVFVGMIQAREKFESIDNLKIYLYAAVKNRSLKYLRHEDVKKRYCQTMEQQEPDEEEYADRILEEEVFALLKKAIEELPEQSRKVFLLTLEGKGNTEIAEILGLSIETVKSYKKSGKKVLFGKLKDPVSMFLFYYYLENLPK